MFSSTGPHIAPHFANPQASNPNSSRILVIDDDKSICDLIAKYLEHHEHSVETQHDGLSLESVLESPFDVVLLDVNLPEIDGLTLLDQINTQRPELSVIMLTAMTDTDSVVDAMRRGAFDYLTKPIDMQRLSISVKNATEKTRLRLESAGLRAAMIRGDGGPTLVCASRPMSEVISLVERVAATNVPVLIQGEAGTGKTVVARRIHARSRHSDYPFITVNCTGTSEPELERELFGDGDQPGKLSRSAHGTLFLDEVSDLTMSMQTRLLRALQEEATGLRIIASTRKHLPSEVTRGAFRADLFYRLNVFSIVVPPLRDRRDDIPALARFGIAQYAAKNAKAPPRLDEQTIEKLYAYDWPGNIRELLNVIEQAAMVASGGVIQTKDLPDEIRQIEANVFDEDSTPGTMPVAKSLDGVGGLQVRPLKTLEREMMIAALKETDGNVSEAARRLGIGRATFYRRAQSHGLSREDGFPG